MPSLPQSSAVPPLQAFDTATQQLVPIGPDTGSAGMYVCGITPYDATTSATPTPMSPSTCSTASGAIGDSR